MFSLDFVPICSVRSPKMFCTIAIVSAVTIYLLNRLVVRSLKVGNYGRKAVFITGCDSGFGKELAIRLDSLGFHVFAGCFSRNGAKSLSDSCSNRLITIIVDVTKTESIEAARQVIQQRLPADAGLWAVVNNAGIGGNLAHLEFCTKEEFLQVLQINLLGYFEVTRLFLPLIRKSKGRIVNMGSISGRMGVFGALDTCAKFGVEALSDVLRREMYPYGVKVSIIEPGTFQTDLVSLERIISYIQQSYEKADTEVKHAYGDDYVKKCENLLRAAGLGASSLEPVTQAYVHAITARFPETRYPVGTDAKYLVLPLTHLPTCISDFILRVALKS